jgi:hypothetical protein
MAIRLPPPRSYFLPIWENGRFTYLTAGCLQQLAWLHLAADSTGYQLSCWLCHCALPSDFFKFISSSDPEDPTLVVCNSCAEEVAQQAEWEDQYWDWWWKGGNKA